MRAVVLRGSGVTLEKDYPDPTPKPDEALIRPLLCGVCNTDLELARGYMGFSGVLGHEFVGVVEEAPDKGLIGKRVAGEINCPCGECQFCMGGLGTIAPTAPCLESPGGTEFSPTVSPCQCKTFTSSRIR
ncbi:MAG: alcohol dehydrogenase catalytic domain-containing protein [Nitrospinae bacterium]|nr:alcohol dehydrogenase catalytic domain-containing protein [Nitrospinota bacterium]